MPQDEAKYPNLHDLAASIGKVQIYWSFLETEMRTLLAKYAPPGASRGPVVARWRKILPIIKPDALDGTLSKLIADIDKAAFKRNILVHGIQTASGDPWRSDGAFVVCADPQDLHHTLRIGDILDLADEIDRIRLLLKKVEFAPEQPPSSSR
ncbi:hypothetical protein LJR098_002619 [Rhizobium sp. LjRoot98]|uniref:hypothetical protein n=1 Tax=Rhizobium sp. LjRoot98 TaxID=3342345 RepID=UPI003ED0D488